MTLDRNTVRKQSTFTKYISPNLPLGHAVPEIGDVQEEEDQLHGKEQGGPVPKVHPSDHVLDPLRGSTAASMGIDLSLSSSFNLLHYKFISFRGIFAAIGVD